MGGGAAAMDQPFPAIAFSAQQQTIKARAGQRNDTQKNDKIHDTALVARMEKIDKKQHDGKEKQKQPGEEMLCQRSKS